MILSDTQPVEVATIESPEVVEVIEAEIEEEKTRIELLVDNAFSEFRASESSKRYSSLPVTLFSTHVEISLNNIKKSIAITEFKDILDSMMAFSEKKLQSYQLPYGCFSFATDGVNMQLQMYYPSSMKTLQYAYDGKTISYEVPFPNVIISHSLKKVKGVWRVQSTRFLCTEKTVPQLGESFISSPDTENGIYLIPVSNTYSEGNMCYGHNSMPVAFNENLRGLDYYYQFLFSSPFNSDLGIKALRTEGVRDWFTKWATLKEPPYKFLQARKY